jgi:peptide/nickel transport system ATP-binding protein
MIASAPSPAPALLEVGGLVVRFGSVNAVDGVDLACPAGQTLGLVGESGSGKSTTVRAIVGLANAASGTIRFAGEDVTHLKGEALRQFRRRIGFVFQDPFSSLDPRHTLGSSVSEPIRTHGLVADRGRLRDRVAELLDLVGLGAAFADRYPHQCSGGQRQRAVIARALSTNPDLLILDEPVASLDVSVQAQVLNLVRRLQSQLGLTSIFVGHDLATVRYMSTSIAVMKSGRIVETGDRATLFANPRDPYTQSLIAAIPRLSLDGRQRPEVRTPPSNFQEQD